jgi:transcription antitermination factor NusG
VALGARHAASTLNTAENIHDETQPQPSWLVVHTLSRAEKRFAEWAMREGFRVELPTYGSVKRYRGKVVRFEKVLFPGYVFVCAETREGARIQQNRHAARVLVPPDMGEFGRQLGEILTAIASGLEIRPASGVQPGTRVKICGGPLRGMEGLVERLEAPLSVVLRLDFISEAASVRLDATDVEVA